ncbi:MAG TPA: hypothetical protein PLM89_04910, partial [Anaerolineales bacterium]|nr:hypothetical protein [Anaerolineales bacterium]
MNNKILRIFCLFALIAVGVFAPKRAIAQTNVPFEQALVLAGGESTNPRDYDPATTHGSGDKLLFSGLVSLDPNLNLIPDLAESWNVNPDGTVYVFH